MLQSIIRLSQAHARLMFRNQVEVFDVVSVVVLMETALDTGLIDFQNTVEQELIDDPECHK
jgi:DNA helicase MCM9